MHVEYSFIVINYKNIAFMKRERDSGKQFGKKLEPLNDLGN